MRIATSAMYDQLLRLLQQNQQDYATLNTRLATTKKILAPSDDVIGTVRAMDYRVNINANGQYKRNVDGATINLNLTSTVLSSYSDTMTSIKKLLDTNISGNSDPANAASDAQLAGQLRDEVERLANTKEGGRYLFSGFRTDQQAYAAGTYAYQGDDGVINVPIDKGAAMPINVTGNQAFSYTIGVPGTTMVKQLSNGMNAHYFQGPGTTMTVVIRQADDVPRMNDDAFTFSNAIQMTDILGTAIGANNTARVQALQDPFNTMQNQLTAVQSEVGSRLSSLQSQSSLISQNTLTMQNALSATEDADLNETAIMLQKVDTTLQALRQSSAKMFSKSLLDFLQ